MTSSRAIGAALAVVLLASPAVRAQEPPKPGPEHEVLKKMEGDWDITMKVEGMEIKGTVTTRMEHGGLWLTSKLESSFGGQKFTGQGLDGYDPIKKKYVGVWVDNMSASPLVLEGTYDKATKTMTMEGTGPGHDGKPIKYKTVSTMPDDNTINFKMYMGGEEKQEAFSIVYKRKK